MRENLTSWPETVAPGRWRYVVAEDAFVEGIFFDGFERRRNEPAIGFEDDDGATFDESSFVFGERFEPIE